MLKILQARLQQYLVHLANELSDVQSAIRKGRGTRDQITKIDWIIKEITGVPGKYLLLLY